MPPAARMTDNHVCPLVTGVVPHVGGPILPPCCPTVLIGYMPAARVTDMATCAGPPDVIVRGSLGVMIGGLPAARVGDNTAHGGVIVVGEVTVMIGDVSFGASFVMPIVRLPNGDIRVGNNIIISGDASFQARVLNDLYIMSQTTVGNARLQSIDRMGHTVTIVSGSGNATRADSYTDAAMAGGPVLGNPSATGTGNGTNSTITYNPAPRPTSADPSISRPGDVALHHELAHAENNGYGRGDFNSDPANPNNPTVEESQVIDQDNQYRDERGIPRRADHTTL